MTFDELKDNEELLNKFAYIYKDSKNYSWDERIDMLKELTEVSERSVRKWAVKLGLSEKHEKVSEDFIKAKKRTYDKIKKRFFITWAQCNTPVNERMFKSMLGYGQKLNASIHVIAGRYKNPTSTWSQAQQAEEERWDPLVKPFLDANRHDIHKYVSIMSDVKTQPTAVNPMSGLVGMGGINSCVFGSPKIQMETVPVLDDQVPKVMLTTGACTYKNYTDSKAGKKGEFHHNFGFVIVEIEDDETFYIRQVTAKDDGSFSDLYYDVEFNGKLEEIEFRNDGERLRWKHFNFNRKPFQWVGKPKIKRNNGIDSFILGDIHYGQHDEELLEDTIKFMDKLKPKHVVLHDVFDGDSISHHQIKDPFVQYQKEVFGKNDLKKEIDAMLDGLEIFRKYENVVIVRSNHDDFLDRWLRDGDWKKQPSPKNSKLYMKFSMMLMEQYERDEVIGIIPELINNRYPEYITLGRRDSYRINGWELGMHGDKGSNGSRGSLNQFRKMNTKMVVGHYHSPGRKDNVLAVGTSTKLELDYNIGPSSWLQSHVIIHKNGKPQHINYIKGGFTNLK